jgi:ubiquinone/menaquinone biosynthesis C-methylase UbiE
MQLSSLSRVLDNAKVYETFHHIFSGEKTIQLKRFLDAKAGDVPLKVLDLGCGPGTSAGLFLDRQRYDYLGVDINPSYIARASRRFPLRFVCSDIAELSAIGETYDLILINSVFHHLTDEQAHHVLGAARALTSANGECVVLDMVRPERFTWATAIQTLLIHMDRGKFCRSISTLHDLIESHFRIAGVKSFTVRSFGGLTLWDLRLFVCSS